MISMRVILNLLIVCILIPRGLQQQEGPELAEEYIDEELPESAGEYENESSSTSKPNKTIDVNPKKAHFSEDRFTQLFKTRQSRPRQPVLFGGSPKHISKPKPTLPSFIKNTPPIVRIQPTPVPNSRNSNQRITAAPQRVTTTRTPPRGSNNSNTNRRNQSNNNRSLNQSTPSPSSTTESSSRRRFGGSSGSRRNITATIPAIRPKRI